MIKKKVLLLLLLFNAAARSMYSMENFQNDDDVSSIRLSSPSGSANYSEVSVKEEPYAKQETMSQEYTPRADINEQKEFNHEKESTNLTDVTDSGNYAGATREGGILSPEDLERLLEKKDISSE